MVNTTPIYTDVEYENLSVNTKNKDSFDITPAGRSARRVIIGDSTTGEISGTLTPVGVDNGSIQTISLSTTWTEFITDLVNPVNVFIQNRSQNNGVMIFNWEDPGAGSTDGVLLQDGENRSILLNPDNSSYTFYIRMLSGTGTVAFETGSQI